MKCLVRARQHNLTRLVRSDQGRRAHDDGDDDDDAKD